MRRAFRAGRFLCFAAALATGISAHSQDSQPPQLLRRGDVRLPHGVISKAALSPPLATQLRALRFSPDGKHILLQDESALYVISRNSLAIEVAQPARYVLPARFSADSASVIVATRDMRVQRWSIAGQKMIDQKKLDGGADCRVAALSPLGTYYACISERLDFEVLDTSTGNPVFLAKAGADPEWWSFGIQPFHVGLARSEPFGYLLGVPFVTLPFDALVRATNIRFSPDERYVLAQGFNGRAVAEDLIQKQKVYLNDSLRHAMGAAALQFVSPGRVIVVSPKRPDDSVVASFPDGRVLDHLAITGKVSPTSDPNYVVYLPAGSKGDRPELLDIETHKAVAQVSKDGTDISGNDIATYRVGVGLVLGQMGSNQNPILARIPAGPLSTLETALASPDLETLVVSVDGEGAAYRVRDGKEFEHFTGLHGAWFDDEKKLIVRVPEDEPSYTSFGSLDVATGETQILWRQEDRLLEDSTLDSGPVVLEEEQHPFDLGWSVGRLGYELRGLDLNSGKPLWSRDLSQRGVDEAPITFTDPQGERVTLGWDGNSERGHQAAKRSAVAQRNMKLKKPNGHDSIFEVLNARTGATEGVAFVPGGSGPEGYTSVYSAGNWLIAVKDERRITVVSLADGDERLHLTAQVSALAGPAGVLATADGGRMSLYDLVAGARKDYYSFPNAVVYLRFSADGKRLLALTEFQELYVLNLTSSKDDSTAPVTTQ